MEVVNLSGFQVQHVLGLDSEGLEVLAVIVKATYDVRKGHAVLSAEQEPVRLADEYVGKPGSSSLLHAGEGAIFKPCAEVLLTGHAYAPEVGARDALVTLKVGSVRKRVRVFGERTWRRTLLSVHPGTPEPFEKLPLVWERAFGGVDELLGAEPRNPIGVGFRAPKSKNPLVDSPVPNLEDPADLLKDANGRPVPAGFGPVCAHWEPRVRRAGTCDAKWMEERAPLLPEDFDPAFAQVAPVDQVLTGYLQGGEDLEVTNASPSRRLACRIPRPDVAVMIAIGEERRSVALCMDTLVVDGDHERFTLALRGQTPVQGLLYDIDWIRIGPSLGSTKAGE